MSQELKQRITSTTANSNELSEKSSSKKNLINLQPDYALKVLLKYNATTKKVDSQDQASLKILTQILELNGFIVTARPDKNTNFVILFLTLGDDEYNELVKLNNETDKLFNVSIDTKTNEKFLIAERLRLIYLKLTLPKSKGGCSIEVGKNNVVGILPVKNILNLNNESKSNLKNIGKFFKKSIRDKNILFLRENLGSKYALYYQFVQTYISYVAIIALIGIFAKFFLGNFSLIYAIINLIVGFICYLNIYANDKKLSIAWNLKNINKTEIIKLEQTELIPSWKIMIRRILFVPITLGGATGLFSAQFACFLLEIFINEIYQGPFKSILALVPTILVCVAVPVGTMIYGIIAKKYLSFEKNPTSSSENNSLLIKMFIFNCLASYSPLLITAFVYLPLGYAVDPYLQTLEALLTQSRSVYSYIPNIPILHSEFKVNNLRMSTQIFYFMVTNQIVATLTEFVVPIVLSRILSIPKIASLLGTPISTKEIDLLKIDDKKEHEYLNLVRENFNKPEVSIDDDYKQHIIQYGFLMLFGPVWTLGALCCLIFGLIQQEGDYLKYIKLSKPVFPNRSESSQPFILFMRILLIVGSFVSMAITLMYNNNKNQSNEILSFVGRTSVDNNWLVIVGGAGISAILTQLLLFCFEQVIDGMYDSNESIEFTKEIKANNLLSLLVKREEGKTISDSNIESVLTEISDFQNVFWEDYISIYFIYFLFKIHLNTQIYIYIYIYRNKL